MTKAKPADDYTVSVQIKKSPQDVFTAIKRVNEWWIGDVKGDSDRIGAEFTYSYKDFHQTTQKVIELIPNKKLVWHVTKSKITFVKNKNEWKDTTIVFDLVATEGGTLLNFAHIGLTPTIECYDGCSGGWDFYIKRSLPSLILTGKGIAPNF